MDIDVYVKFESAKSFYLDVWKKDRLGIINELNDIKDALQEQERIHNIGNITYSGVGLVGGGLAIAGIIAAPFTLGVSLGLTIAGAATGITSGVAGLTHAFVKIGIIKSKCNTATESIKNHDQKTEEMKNLIRCLMNEIQSMDTSLEENKTGVMENEIQLMEVSLEENETGDRGIELMETLSKENKTLIIEGMKTAPGVGSVGFRTGTLVLNSIASNTLRVTGNADEVAKILSLGPALQKAVPSVMQDVSRGVAKLSSEALSAVAAVGIVIDIVSLVVSARDLYKISKGELSKQAKHFDDIVKAYEKEMEEFRKCFEN